MCFGFGVVTMITTKYTIFWDMMPCTVTEVYLNYKALQPRSSHSSGKRSGYCRINIRITVHILFLLFKNTFMF
jgi:hypothetical protein